MKKKYIKPEVILYGNILELTLGGNSGGGDFWGKRFSS